MAPRDPPTPRLGVDRVPDPGALGFLPRVAPVEHVESAIALNESRVPNHGRLPTDVQRVLEQPGLREGERRVEHERSDAPRRTPGAKVGTKGGLGKRLELGDRLGHRFLVHPLQGLKFLLRVVAGTRSGILRPRQAHRQQHPAQQMDAPTLADHGLTERWHERVSKWFDGGAIEQNIRTVNIIDLSTRH